MNRKQKMAEFDQGYNITVTGRHVHVTEAMKDYCIEKISKLEHFGHRIIDVFVTMDIQKHEHRVDIIMKYAHTTIKSHAASTDMYASTDLAVHKLERQLKKYKEKLKDHHAKAHPITQVPVTMYSMPEDISGVQDDIASVEYKNVQYKYEAPEIVHTDTQVLHILNDEEAIMKMELSQAYAMAFLDEATRKLKVIYRVDGNKYGIIKPEERSNKVH